MTAESITPRSGVAATSSNLSLDVLRLLCEEHWLTDREIQARVSPTPIENLRVHLFALCEAGLIGTFQRGDRLLYLPTAAGRKRIREIDERSNVAHDSGPGTIAWLFVSIVGFVIAALTYASC